MSSQRLVEETAYGSALDRAAGLLEISDRTEADVRRRLRSDGFTPPVIDAVVDRLVERSLLDEASFARRWAVRRLEKRIVSGRVIVEELIAKGIDPEVARAAVDDVVPGEEDHARQVALRLLERMHDLPLRKQAARLQRSLAARGFGADAVEAAVTNVLPPEDWD